MTYMSLINRIAYSYDIPPQMLNEGLLWFPDLSAPDPTGILPIAGGVVTMLNMLNSTTTGGSATMRKMRKYIIILPVLSIPIQMTFPAAFNVYWLASSLVQLVIVTGFRMDSFRAYLGVPKALPGTKLDRQYKGLAAAALPDHGQSEKIHKHEPKSTKQKGLMVTTTQKEHNE